MKKRVIGFVLMMFLIMGAVTGCKSNATGTARTNLNNQYMQSVSGTATVNTY